MKTDHYSFLDVRVQDGIAFVTLNNPDTGNRFALADEWEFNDLTQQLGSDTEVRAVVLTGAGDTFSGGAHHSDDPFDPIGYYNRSIKLFGGFVNLDTPVIVAVNGPATGSGLTFALFGDIVVAEQHVRFADPHVLGGVVSATGPFQWPPSIGLMRAKRYLLTGDSFSADEAYAMGLVSEVVESGQSLARATEFAEKVATLSPKAVQGTKRALNEWFRTAFGPVFQHGLALEFLSFPAAESSYGSGEISPERSV